MLDFLLDTPGTELNGIAQHNILQLACTLLDGPDEIHFTTKQQLKKVIDRFPGIKAKPLVNKQFAKLAHFETINQCKRLP
jgi:hypothetical protein